MPPEETAAIREDERVTRLFAARTRDRVERLGDATARSNDIGGVDRPHLFFPHLEERLDEAFEQKLFEPLSRIRTMASVLDGDSGARHGPQLSAISDAAERAEAMLRDMLDFMRSAAGGQRIARRRVDLKLLCERVIDAIHSSHPDRPMVFRSDPRVEGLWDPERMAMLVSKLVLNAIDHGPPRPAIRIELEGRLDHAVLQVWNAGGISEAEPRDRLFEPFVCGSLRRAGVSQGLGLGLFLAREIAHAHDGRIDVQSCEINGTTFRVTIPRS
jgi:signal transduction histidine kinase